MSSSTMPAPPGNCSMRRMGGGFQISNSRNSPKASSKRQPIEAQRARQREPLAENLIHHHHLRVFPPRFRRNDARGPDRRVEKHQRRATRNAIGRIRGATAAMRSRCGQRARPCREPSGIAAAEPCGETKTPTAACSFGVILHRLAVRQRSSGGRSRITYFSVAQLPRSISRQRSLQNGASGSSEFDRLFADRALHRAGIWFGIDEIRSDLDQTGDRRQFARRSRSTQAMCRSCRNRAFP